MLAAPAGAAPTCVDNAGATVRCEAPGALPVGVAASQVDPERDDGVPLPAPAMLFGLFCVVGGLFALIGLMPDFDGWSPEDWERRRKGD